MLSVLLDVSGIILRYSILFNFWGTAMLFSTKISSFKNLTSNALFPVFLCPCQHLFSELFCFYKFSPLKYFTYLQACWIFWFGILVGQLPPLGTGREHILCATCMGCQDSVRGGVETYWDTGVGRINLLFVPTPVSPYNKKTTSNPIEETDELKDLIKSPWHTLSQKSLGRTAQHRTVRPT